MVCALGTHVDAIGSVVLGELVQGLDLITRTFASDLIDGFARVDAADHASVGTVDSSVSIKLVLNKLLLLLGEAGHRLPLTTNLAAIPIRKCQRGPRLVASAPFSMLQLTSRPCSRQASHPGPGN